MRKDDAVRLQHMLDAGREALGFARGRGRSDLDRDRMLVLALVKDVEEGSEVDPYRHHRRRRPRQVPRLGTIPHPPSAIPRSEIPARI
jgi:hypothetical protein